jgi:hypothetical protein
MPALQRMKLMDDNLSLRHLSNGGAAADRFRLTARCPSCHRSATLDDTGLWDLDLNSGYEDEEDVIVAIAGFRFCPSPDCRQFIFVVYSPDGEMIRMYPAERIDFDSTNIPSNVLKTLEEAISCHAIGSYVASGMMVRKTLEELCEDRKAKGKNLKEKIADLGNSVMMPKELLDGLDDLRLLGNDAAHVQAKTYLQVGKEEIEISIEFTKEVLKAVYQYSHLLARLQSLKKP